MKDLQLPDQSPCSITGLQFLNNIIWAFDVNSRESSIIEQQNIISDYSFTFLVAMKSQIQSWSFHSIHEEQQNIISSYSFIFRASIYDF